MASAAIDYCPKKGVWMPAGHCAGGDRYQRVARRGVIDFIEATAGADRGVCIQAGGHAGFWPRELAQHYDAVLTFEPHGANFRALCANVEAAHVYPFRATLGDGCDVGAVGLTEHHDNTGGHYVTPVDDAADAVPQLAIDALDLSRLDALLLDVEGAELLAIEGAVATIERFRPVLLIEERGHIESKVGVGLTENLHDLLHRLEYEAGDWLGHDRLWIPR